MEMIISDLSKYIIMVFMTIYALESILYFKYKSEKIKNGVYTRQIICMFVVHFVGFAAICLETSDATNIIFYGFQQILLFATVALFRVVYQDANRLLVNNMCLLLSIGFVVLTRLSFQKAVRQVVIVAISILIGLFIPYFVKRLTFLKKLYWIYAVVGVGFLGIVFLLGAVTNGSKLSFSILGVSFQPSEVVKIIFVFFVASILTKSKSFLNVVIATTIAGIHVMILVLSKDLGSALIFFVVYLGMLFVATSNYLYLLLGMLGGTAAGVVAATLFSHVRVRLLAYKNPWGHIDGAGYQIAQSLFAIGTGGWFGMGIYQGNPTTIPYVEADFIFSAIAEEFGVIFSIAMIVVCLSSFFVVIQVVYRLKDEFYRYVGLGLGILYIFQIFLTIGGGTKFIPLTGVTLPLVSYGGTSVLSTIVVFSIIQGLYLVQAKEGNGND